MRGTLRIPRRFIGRLIQFAAAAGIVILVVSLSGPPQSAQAVVSLTIEEITWSVIGLDSNNVNAGPQDYPVGVRVCNEGDEATPDDIEATFAFTTSSSYISLVNSSPTQTFGPLGAGECRDIYYSVRVARDSNAYDETAVYTITVTDGTNTVVEGQTLYVEHLVSQNRNSTTTISGPTWVEVGNTYIWTVDASTATNGYEEIEHFLTFCPDVYRLDSVVTNYSRPNPPGLSYDYDTFWGDGCTWNTDTNVCGAGTVKYGGSTIQYEYHVTIIGPGSCTLYDMVYDFSGSSFHYNSDYLDVSLNVVAGADLGITKTDSPDPVTVGDNVTYTVTIHNYGPNDSPEV